MLAVNHGDTEMIGVGVFLCSPFHIFTAHRRHLYCECYLRFSDDDSSTAVALELAPQKDLGNRYAFFILPLLAYLVKDISIFADAIKHTGRNHRDG